MEPFTPTSNVYDGNNHQSGVAYDDGRGNVTQIGGYTYQYDAENHLISSILAMPGMTITSATYAYDGDGRRVAKQSGGLTTIYVYDVQGELAAEYAVGGAAPALPCTTCYVMADHLGSTRMLTDGNGSQKALYDYAPFGEELKTQNGRDDRWGGAGYGLHFSGKEQEDTEGEYMQYFGARYYSAGQGRFTSPDPPLLDQHILDPQSWNLYTYTRNNPLRYVDPRGQEVELIGDEEERKKALGVLQGSVGKKAGDRLWVQTVTKDGKDHYMVRIKGDSSDFAKLGTAAADLSSLVGAKPVVEFGVTNSILPGAGRRQAGYTYAPGEIGNDNVRVLVNPALVQQASLDFETVPLLMMKFAQGATIRDMTLGAAAFHEFGHAWGMWQNLQARGSIIPGSSGIDPHSGTAQRALDWENRMRVQLYGPFGPNNAKRVQH